MDNIEQVYSGKYIVHNEKLYQFVPEKEKKSCIGCALMHINTCTKEITNDCNQGYILKRVIL